jgi:hypothetical protein
MREKEIEHHLVMETEKAGGMALKFVSPSYAACRTVDTIAGWEDGLCGSQGAGAKPRPLQLKRHAMLRDGLQVSSWMPWRYSRMLETIAHA